MNTVKVIGPINGSYHLGYFSKDQSTFHAINEFINPALAQAMADKMNLDNARQSVDGARHGR